MMTKQRMLSILAALLALCLCCGAMAEAGPSEDLSLYFTERDLLGDWDDSEAVPLTLTGSVTIDAGGVYVLSGTIADGTIVVNVPSDEKVQLVFNGVSVSCSTTAALVVLSADKVFITLAPGTVNSLVSTGFTKGEADGAVYAKDDIVFNGQGALNVGSAANGIVGNDDVKFTGGAYTINAKERGIDANDSVRVSGGVFTINSGKSPLRAKNKKDPSKGQVIILGGSFLFHQDGAD